MMICPFCFEKHETLLKAGITSPIFNELKIVGGGYRACICPTCGSTDRERLVYIFLVDIIEVFKQSDLKLLHVAPEKNIYTALKCHFEGEYTVGSIDKQQYTFADNFVEFDLTDAIFDDNSFDLIICNHVLEHIEPEKDAVSELKRILKPNGVCILQVPIALGLDKTIDGYKSPFDRLKYFGQSDHVRLYGKDYQSRLEQYGLSVSKVSLYKQYYRYGINEEEDLYVITKCS